MVQEGHSSCVESPYASPIKSSPSVFTYKFIFCNSLRSNHPENYPMRKSIQIYIIHDIRIMDFYVQLQELCDFENLEFS